MGEGGGVVVAGVGGGVGEGEVEGARQSDFLSGDPPEFVQLHIWVTATTARKKEGCRSMTQLACAHPLRSRHSHETLAKQMDMERKAGQDNIGSQPESATTGYCKLQ